MARGAQGMPLSYEVRSLYRFGVFELEAQTGELRRHGIKLKLQDQPYQVLLKLLEHAGQTVTREQLRSTLWPADTFVDFETGLNTTIKRLRETLGDSADNPAFIETVPKRGYRFIAPVSTPDAGPDLVPNKPNQARGVRLNPVLQFGAVLILVLLLVGFALRHWSTATSLPTRVLDFAQLTSDGQAKQGRLLSEVPESIFRRSCRWGEFLPKSRPRVEKPQRFPLVSRILGRWIYLQKELNC
jgi:DNA-binding winged helix-turn-helix (wHTH) protein